MSVFNHRFLGAGSACPRRSRVRLVMLFAGAALGLGSAAEAQVIGLAVPKVQVTVRLKTITLTDDMDDAATRGCGDIFFAWHGRFENASSTSADTGATDKETVICSGVPQQIDKIIFEEIVCCPVPEVELVINFWDDDNNTLEKIAKIITGLAQIAAGVFLPAGQSEPVSDGAEAIRDAISEGGEPTRDDVGTFSDLDLAPPAPCNMADEVLTTHDIKLNGGAGAVNGSIALSWKAVKIGWCSIMLDLPGDGAGPGDDIQQAEGDQNSGTELGFETSVFGNPLFEPLPPGAMRRFEYGVDTDLDRATGSSDAPFVGAEWRLVVLQVSGGVTNTSSAHIDQWTDAGWAPTILEPLHHEVQRGHAGIVVSAADLGIAPGAQLEVAAAIVRDGLLVDRVPDDPALNLQQLEWRVDAVPPDISRALPFDEDGDGIDGFSFELSEYVPIADGAVHVHPPIPGMTTVQDYRTYSLEFPDSPAPGTYTVAVSADISDAAGNALDGNGDGVGGDAAQFTFVVPDRSILSADGSGALTNEFLPGENIFVLGSALPPLQPSILVLMRDNEVQPGAPLQDLTQDGPSQAFIGPDGTFGPTPIGPAQGEGEYSIVADLNLNFIYDPEIDRLWQPGGIGVNVATFIDCDLDGIEDPTDILAGEPDDNGNGIPDACECAADWNGDTVIGSSDITAFLSDWFSDLANGTLVADFNNSGVTGSSDITAFLSAWFAALAGAC
ncbi:MAG: hypothetical protein H7Y88_01980 [Phycisphaerales bacterium]|nr:hypothetical protein [Phycisphaerales bacterium]